MVPTREQILSMKRGPKMVPIDVPYWPSGGRVYIRELTGKEKDAFEAKLAAEFEKAKKAGAEYKPNIRGLITAACCCKDDGTPIFEMEDADALGNFPAWHLDAVIENADQLNHFTSKYKEDLEKKYASPGGSSSVTDSRTDGESKTPKDSSNESPSVSSKAGGRTGR